MGILGIETASFAAFIAGAVLVVLRPFKAGDHVTTAGVTGTVLDVDLPALLITCKEALAATPGVLATPAPEVELISFDATHLKLAIRPYTTPDSYWATLFAATTALLPHLDSLSPAGAAAELEEEDFEADEGAGESEEE